MDIMEDMRGAEGWDGLEELGGITCQVKLPMRMLEIAVNLNPSKEDLEASFKDKGNAGSIDGVPVNPVHVQFNRGGHTSGIISEKGSINVNAIPGGFDSFLDQWDAVTEFYFDDHFAKRSELNSLGPFEIQVVKKWLTSEAASAASRDGWKLLDARWNITVATLKTTELYLFI
ncbi:hypothetical protein Taro_037435 [Colocasia esculenta]|uniref:Uncharacterized protein n=1 Tax=Colocasia esculenta TaxID=4460 RepID=A0A843W0I8_COLES|nr:hypothetical protein [Colocasia esculenta]